MPSMHSYVYVVIFSELLASGDGSCSLTEAQKSNLQALPPLGPWCHPLLPLAHPPQTSMLLLNSSKTTKMKMSCQTVRRGVMMREMRMRWMRGRRRRVLMRVGADR